MYIHDSFPGWLDLKSWHVGKYLGESYQYQCGARGRRYGLGFGLYRKIFESTERDRGNLAFAVVSSQVLGRVQMEKLRQAFENGTADISQTLIRGFE